MKLDILKYSWNVSEQEYRDSPALSYSILSRYERNGFSSIPHLREPEESPALLFGSVVDSLVLSGENDFNDRFIVEEEGLERPAESCVRVLETLAETFYQKDIQDISDTDIDKTCEQTGFWSKRQSKTRILEIRKYDRYYRFLKQRKDRTVITRKDYDDAIRIRNRIMDCPGIGQFFRNHSDILPGYSQLKFKTELYGIQYRIMVDRIVVDHEHRIVTPIDLKTTGLPEYEFYKSFLKFRYDIQARLYHTVLAKVLLDSNYRMNDFLFVAVNKETLNPLIWRWKTVEDNTIEDKVMGKDKNILLRSPFTIGQELGGYLQSDAMVPEGIGWENDLQTWINR